MPAAQPLARHVGETGIFAERIVPKRFIAGMPPSNIASRQKIFNDAFRLGLERISPDSAAALADLIRACIRAGQNDPAQIVEAALTELEARRTR
ncbi:MAG: hypothetical protein JO237_14290 [Pseudolabrys sp.]|nr:hypothetical protein [Pseudolabrys sp.]